MSDNTIPPSDAGLILRRLVTDRVPILAWFVSADKTVNVKVDGFLCGFSSDLGMAISSEIPKSNRGSYIEIAPAFFGATFRYTDETELPVEFKFGSGLRIDFPNGNTLTVLEKRPSRD